MPCGTVRLIEVKDGIYQCHVREGLRKIANLLLFVRIVFLGKQADVIAEFEQALQELFGFPVAPRKLVGVRKPETARKESPFPDGHEGVALGSPVTHEQSFADEPLFDAAYRAENARVVSRQEAKNGQQEQAGINFL